MQGKRVPYDGTDPYLLVKDAGDYCGPVMGYSGPVPAVFFLLPIAKDKEAPDPGARCLHHVCSPPHVFKEESDGSLTIRESIGAGPSGNYYYHGYLNHGCWELEKRD